MSVCSVWYVTIFERIGLNQFTRLYAVFDTDLWGNESSGAASSKPGIYLPLVKRGRWKSCMLLYNYAK